MVTSDYEKKAREEHPEGDDHCTREGITNATIHVSTVKSHECGEDDQWGWQDVTNSNAIDERLLEHPSSAKYCFCLDERDGSECPSKGQTAGNKPQTEQMSDVGSRSYSQCER
jgi:hypothetical protein